MDSPNVKQEETNLTAVQDPANWTPKSWQGFAAAQQAEYPDQQTLSKALANLAGLPPLVTSWEINSLRKQLADAEAGRSFLL